MFKNILAFVSVFVLIFLSAPLTTLSTNVTVCKNGKSSGVFVSEVTLSDLLLRDGVSVVMDKEYDYLELAKRLKATKMHSFNDGYAENIYFYTNKLQKKEIVNGKAVNLHVAITNEKVVIGTPLIYGGY